MATNVACLLLQQGDVGHLQEQGAQPGQQRQAVQPQRLVLGHDHHLIEEAVHHLAQVGQHGQRLLVVAGGEQRRQLSYNFV